jgi:hypothetical protein
VNTLPVKTRWRIVHSKTEQTQPRRSLLSERHAGSRCSRLCSASCSPQKSVLLSQLTTVEQDYTECHPQNWGKKLANQGSKFPHILGKLWPSRCLFSCNVQTPSGCLNILLYLILSRSDEKYSGQANLHRCPPCSITVIEPISYKIRVCSTTLTTHIRA